MLRYCMPFHSLSLHLPHLFFPLPLLSRPSLLQLLLISFSSAFFAFFLFLRVPPIPFLFSLSLPVSCSNFCFFFLSLTFLNFPLLYLSLFSTSFFALPLFWYDAI